MLWRSSVKSFQLALGTVLIDAVTSNPGESGSSPDNRA